MAIGNQIPDKTLLQTVQKRLAQKCGSARVTATVRGGDVTITGVLKQEHERKLILRCLASLQGVKRVIDQIQLEEKKKMAVVPIWDPNRLKPAEEQTTPEL